MKQRLTRSRALVTVLVVSISFIFDFGLSASAGTQPKHFDAPTAIAFVGNRAFVTDFDNDTFTLFDAVTDRFEHVPPEWFRLDDPAQVVTVGKYAWVCAGGQGTFSEFGPDGSHFVRTVSPQIPRIPFIGNLTASGGSLWFSSISNNSLYELNGTTGKVMNQTSLPIKNPQFVIVMGEHIWVTSAFTNAMAELDLTTGQLVQSVSVPFIGGVMSFAINGNDLWLSDGNALAELNGSSGAVLRVVSKRAYLRGEISLASGGGDIWIATGFKNTLTELNASTGKIVRTINKVAGEFSEPVDVVYRNGVLWVVNKTGNSVSQIDAASGKLIRNFS
jgi:DNA-binding beta-propeller fold protein YncE